MAFCMSEISINACVKGYHAYKVKPDEGVVLDVKPDLTNRIDKKAVGVFWNNKLIGHVPAKPVPLKSCFNDLLERYIITW